MKQIVAPLLVAAMALTGCAKMQHQDAKNAFYQDKVNCIISSGGTGGTLSGVPYQNMPAVINCFNQAENYTLIPVYNNWGYSPTATYQKQSILLDVAEKCARREISSGDVDRINTQLDLAVLQDLHNQDARMKAQRAQATQELNNQLILQQQIDNNRQAEMLTNAMNNRPRQTNCRIYGNNINCTEW